MKVREREEIGELINDQAREKVEKIATNIEGLSRKLGDPRVPEDKKRLLQFNLDKALRALRECQNNLSDFAGI